MIAQYTQAGIVSELKRLAVPASVDSIPSSAMQEDHVSMGWSAARKLRRSIDGAQRVVAIELLTAARAIDLRAPLTPSAGFGCGRRHASARRCRRPAPTGTSRPEIAAAVAAVQDGSLLDRGAARGPTRRRRTRMTDAVQARGRCAPVAARDLHTLGWPQEAALRMLQNNLDPEVAEHPDKLVVYGGTGKAARDWNSFDAIVRTLTTLKNDETMLVQSGKPVGRAADARVGAPRAARQLEPRRRLGELG